MTRDAVRACTLQAMVNLVLRWLLSRRPSRADLAWASAGAIVAIVVLSAREARRDRDAAAPPTPVSE